MANDAIKAFEAAVRRAGNPAVIVVDTLGQALRRPAKRRPSKRPRSARHAH
jgi:hypothetical protein